MKYHYHAKASLCDASLLPTSPCTRDPRRMEVSVRAQAIKASDVVSFTGEMRCGSPTNRPSSSFGKAPRFRQDQERGSFVCRFALQARSSCGAEGDRSMSIDRSDPSVHARPAPAAPASSSGDRESRANPLARYSNHERPLHALSRARRSCSSFPVRSMD